MCTALNCLLFFSILTPWFHDISIAGEESPALPDLTNSILGNGIAEQRRTLAANLADKNQLSRRGKSKPKDRTPREPDIHEVDSSSDDERQRARSRSSRRRSRSRTPETRRGYSAHNWVILGQFWPVDQRPAVPYQGIFA